MSRAPDFSPRDAEPTYAEMQANAVNPPQVQCSVCTEEMWGGYGVDGLWFCNDCIDRVAFLALAREHSAAVRMEEGRHAR